MSRDALTRRLTAQPLSREAFEAFGEVIEIAGRRAEPINEGRAQKWADLATLDTQTAGGRSALHRYRSRPVGLPFTVEDLECHPLGSQAFIPLHDRPFLVVVAPAGNPPAADSVRAFLTDGQQGVNLFRGTWHHPQLTLGEAGDYLVIDRAGPGPNLEECRLAVTLQVDAPG
jgi:ureidoglycolate lyase